MKPIPMNAAKLILRIAFEGDYGDEYNGAGYVTLKNGARVFVIFSNGEGWEHVSVSRRDRLPLWDEMMEIKRLFWRGDEAAIMFAPPEAEYVNNHAYCLHWWRPIDEQGNGVPFPRPPAILVGYPGIGELPLQKR